MYNLNVKDADLKGNLSLGIKNGQYYITGFRNSEDIAEFIIETDTGSNYTIEVMSGFESDNTVSYNDFYVDGIKVGSFPTNRDKPGILEGVYISEGKHTVGIGKSWGYINLFSVSLLQNKGYPAERLNISRDLINKNALPCAKKLYNFLCDSYGKAIITGQQTGGEPNEITAIYKATGKYPALRGFDFMDYAYSRRLYGADPYRKEDSLNPNETERAIDWWNNGGIVTFCWHWNSPTDLINEAPDKLWWSGFYTRATRFDIEKVLNEPDSESYRLILQDIETVAKELKKLEFLEIPVLWRPLHEASGGWFWWGAKGPKACIKLWKLLYDRLTNVHKVNNLIWVWNGQAKDWYPGDDYVDIIGEDVYGGEKAYSSQAPRFYDALAYTKSNKIVTLSENGTIPDPDLLIRDRAAWSWYCTWCGGFVFKKDEKGELIYSGEHTELDMLKKVYGHPYVYTREKLPDLKNYRY